MWRTQIGDNCHNQYVMSMIWNSQSIEGSLQVKKLPRYKKVHARPSSSHLASTLPNFSAYAISPVAFVSAQWGLPPRCKTRVSAIFAKNAGLVWLAINFAERPGRIAKSSSAAGCENSASARPETFIALAAHDCAKNWRTRYESWK